MEEEGRYEVFLTNTNSPEKKSNRKWGFLGAAVAISMLVVGAVNSPIAGSGSTFSSESTADQCPPTADYWFVILGEKDVAGDEYIPRPDLSLHRDILGYSDDDLDEFWQQASEFFETNWGVAGVETWPVVDADAGMRYSPDGKWSAQTLSVNSGSRVFFSSPFYGTDGITPDCAAMFQMETIQISRLVNGEGEVYPATPYGGGYEVQRGDVVGFGDCLPQLNGNYEAMRYQSTVPLRSNTNLGGFFNNIVLSHPTFGEGRMISAVKSNSGPDGTVHNSVRAVMTFPAEY